MKLFSSRLPASCPCSGRPMAFTKTTWKRARQSASSDMFCCFKTRWKGRKPSPKKRKLGCLYSRNMCKESYKATAAAATASCDPFGPGPQEVFFLFRSLAINEISPSSNKWVRRTLSLTTGLERPAWWDGMWNGIYKHGNMYTLENERLESQNRGFASDASSFSIGWFLGSMLIF